MDASLHQSPPGFKNFAKEQLSSISEVLQKQLDVVLENLVAEHEFEFEVTRSSNEVQKEKPATCSNYPVPEKVSKAIQTAAKAATLQPVCISKPESHSGLRAAEDEDFSSSTSHQKTRSCMNNANKNVTFDVEDVPDLVPRASLPITRVRHHVTSRTSDSSMASDTTLNSKLPKQQEGFSKLLLARRSMAGPTLLRSTGLDAKMPMHGLRQHSETRKLSDSTPQSHAPLACLPVWTEMRRSSSIGMKRMLALQAWDSEDNTDVVRQDFSSRTLNCLQSYVVPPSCVKRLLWDFIGCLFILYDVAMIPLTTFDLPETSSSRKIQWVTRIFWTLDMPSSLLTGYMLPDGGVVMGLNQIAWRYAKSWLLLDAVAVSVDWVDFFMLGVGGVSAARMGKTMRIVRMLRLLRLLRVAKLPVIAGTLFESYIRSEKFMLIASMVKLLCLIVGIMHFIACFWWSIGRDDSLPETWVQSVNLQEEPFRYQYATSFHWSLTQFTGTMEVNPTNFTERFFAISVLLFAFVVSAAFISSITSSMTRLQMISGNKTEMFAMLRQFLEENSISRRLQARLERNAHHAYRQYERTTPEIEIELLKLVSEPLRVELHFELYASTLSTNPFFGIYEKTHPAAIRRVCHNAVSTMFLAMGDVLFVEGEAPQIPQMYFILRGTVSYKREAREVQKLNQGAWFAEPVLWCSWTHCGVLRAEADAQLLVLDAVTFQSIAPQITAKAFAVCSYALAYVDILNENLAEGALSDMDETNISHRSVQKVCNGSFRDNRRSVFNRGRSLFFGHSMSSVLPLMLGGGHARANDDQESEDDTSDEESHQSESPKLQSVQIPDALGEHRANGIQEI